MATYRAERHCGLLGTILKSPGLLPPSCRSLSSLEMTLSLAQQEGEQLEGRSDVLPPLQRRSCHDPGSHAHFRSHSQDPRHSPCLQYNHIPGKEIGLVPIGQHDCSATSVPSRGLTGPPASWPLLGRTGTLDPREVSALYRTPWPFPGSDRSAGAREVTGQGPWRTGG